MVMQNYRKYLYRNHDVLSSSKEVTKKELINYLKPFRNYKVLYLGSIRGILDDIFMYQNNFTWINEGFRRMDYRQIHVL